MKLKNGFMLHQVCDAFIVFSTDGKALDYNRMIRLNKTGSFLWEQLEQADCTKEDLINTLTEHFLVDEATATADVNEFITLLQKADLLV